MKTKTKFFNRNQQKSTEVNSSPQRSPEIRPYSRNTKPFTEKMNTDFGEIFQKYSSVKLRTMQIRITFKNTPGKENYVKGNFNISSKVGPSGPKGSLGNMNSPRANVKLIILCSIVVRHEDSSLIKSE